MHPFLEKNFSSNPEGKTEDDRGVNKQLRTVVSSDTAQTSTFICSSSEEYCE